MENEVNIHGTLKVLYYEQYLQRLSTVDRFSCGGYLGLQNT